MTALPRIVEQLLTAARADEHGRSAELLVHDSELRQTVIALRAGAELSEHNSPPAASIQVLSGRVEVTGAGRAVLAAGELAVLPHLRHGVVAVEDSAFLLTTVTSTGQPSHGTDG